MLIMLNCRNRNHNKQYHRCDAFFDLDRICHSRERALLAINSICCVISYLNRAQRSGGVILDFWIYKREIEHKKEKNCVGLLGVKIGSTVVKKDKLNSFPAFHGVLNAKGNFNRFCIKHSDETHKINNYTNLKGMLR